MAYSMNNQSTFWCAKVAIKLPSVIQPSMRSQRQNFLPYGNKKPYLWQTEVTIHILLSSFHSGEVRMPKAESSLLSLNISYDPNAIVRFCPTIERVREILNSLNHLHGQDSNFTSQCGDRHQVLSRSDARYNNCSGSGG